ncbi:MAG: hypothetical protein JWO59_36 [Chloroflexi bacterium]|nr:hypothetical protein [Chloroflexota bacterium]
MREVRSILPVVAVLALLVGPLMQGTGRANGIPLSRVAPRPSAAGCVLTEGGVTTAEGLKASLKARFAANALQVATLAVALQAAYGKALIDIRDIAAAKYPTSNSDPAVRTQLHEDPQFRYFFVLTLVVKQEYVRLLEQIESLDQLAQDPADPHFGTIATPQVQAQAQIHAGQGLTPSEAAALNALNLNTAQLRAYDTALLTSINRAQGAAQAHDSAWQLRQAAAADQYGHRLAALTAAEPGLRARLRGAVTAGGHHLSVTTADVRTAQQDLAAHGQPAAVVQDLGQAGTDAATLAQATHMLVAVDPTAAAGTFPADLQDPGLDEATTASAGALQQFGAAAACSAGKPLLPTQPTKLTLTVNGTPAESTVNHRSTYVDLPSPVHFGTTLTVQAVTDAPMPQGWFLHVYRTGMQDPKLGGYLQVCHTVTTTCSYSSAEMPALTKQYDTVQESVFAVVSAPTYTALNSQITFNWKKT